MIDEDDCSDEFFDELVEVSRYEDTISCSIVLP